MSRRDSHGNSDEELPFRFQRRAAGSLDEAELEERRIDPGAHPDSDVRPVTAHSEGGDTEVAPAWRPDSPARPPVPAPAIAQARPALATPAWLEGELARERAARDEAQRAAARLAAEVAKEHRLRLHAEREAREAMRELEMIRTHRYLTLEQPASGRTPRARYWWRRVRRTLRA